MFKKNISKIIKLFLITFLIFNIFLIGFSNNNSNVKSNQEKITKLNEQAKTIENSYYLLLGVFFMATLITIFMIFSRFEFKEIKYLLVGLVFVIIYLYFIFK